MAQKLKYGPYSPSRLETATCGMAFYDQYIAKKESATKKLGSLPQERGSALHEVLEQITKKMVVNKNYTFDSNEVRTWVAESISKYPVAYQETGLITEMAKLYIAKPPKFLTTDAQTELRLAIKPQGAGFVECDYEDPDALARGRADIFMISDDTTTAYIIDHKSQPNIEPADTFQLGFYAWVIFTIYPFLKEIRTILHFTRFGYYSEEYVWTREQILEIEDEVLTKIQIIENRTEWLPIPHKNCTYCNKVLECPEWRDLIEIGEHGMHHVKINNFAILDDQQKAIKFAGLINIIEELNKKLKDALKTYVTQTGPIAIPGKVYEFRADESIHWDKVNKTMREQVYAIFEKHKVDPRSFMGFSQTFTKQVWVLGNEELVKELSAVLPRKVSTEFSGYKI